MADLPKTRILLVDDHPVIRAGIASTLNKEPDLLVCAQAASCAEAMVVLKQHQVDMALVDLRLEDGSGLKLIAEMAAEYPQVATLVFSMHADEQFAERAIRAGAKGYVMKQEPTSILLQAVRRVRNGRLHVRADLEELIFSRLAEPDKKAVVSEMDNLTNREVEVMQLMAEGKNRQEIAEVMKLSVKTVENYRESMKHKLNLRDTTQLAQYASRMIQSFNI